MLADMVYFQGCGNNFRGIDAYKQHMRDHSNQGHVCDICGKTFNALRKVNYHRRSHLEAYRWPCYYCEEKFNSLCAFKNHLAKVHPQMKTDVEKRSSIRLYQCHKCDKVYGQKNDLERHVYIHDGLKPHVCQHCSKGFNDQNNLRNHVKRLHSEDKRMQCALCYKRFVHQEALKLHQHKIHGIAMEADDTPKN